MNMTLCIAIHSQKQVEFMAANLDGAVEVATLKYAIECYLLLLI